MTSIFIDGEAGTTGLQIRERLRGRSDIEFLSVDAERRKDPAARRELLNSADVAILCLPDDAAKEAVQLIDPTSRTRVIDASSAFRVTPGWVYGFAEMSRQQGERIAEANRVTNPGCYPQGLIALLRPLVDAGLMAADYPVTYTAISGYSGGGRKMIEDYEAKGTDATPFLPYGLTLAHKHVPEMTLYARLTREPLFQPSIGNFAQGMLGTIPLFTELLDRAATAADIHTCLSTAYEGSSFLEVAPLEAIERSPEINPQALNGTNRMRLHVFTNDERGQVLLLALYDNLGKGASGAAVQNLNLMIGAEENLGTSLAA